MSVPDIFLSYNREDADRATHFAEAFDAEGFSVWWDANLRSGEAYDRATEAALKGARAVVVLWSPRSVESRWVRSEATLADRNKTLVPAMIEPCERPVMFELTQTAELGHWFGDREDKAWRAFVGDIREFIEAAGSRATRQAPKSGPARSDEPGEAPAVALLPFRNRSGLPEDTDFAENLEEDLIDALSQRVNARVVSRAATARFRSAPIPDLEALANQLGVRYVIEGNVRRSGAEMRVTAQLVATGSGTVVWNQKFERPLADLAALQEELVDEVARHLDTQIYNLEMASALRKDPDSVNAWEAVQRALAAYRHVSHESMAVAVKEGERAVAISPAYGIGHAVLANALACHYMLTPDFVEDPPLVERIRGHAEQAVALAPNDAMALTFAAIAYQAIGEWRASLHCGTQALQISPGAFAAHNACCTALSQANRWQEAIEHGLAELRITSGNQADYIAHHNLALAYLGAGELDEAQRHFDLTLQKNPDFNQGRDGLVLVLAEKGETDAARKLFAQSRAHDPTRTLASFINVASSFLGTGEVMDRMKQHLNALWEATGSA